MNKDMQDVQDRSYILLILSIPVERPEMNDALRFVEITDISDELLLPWLDLYEISFPPEEKVLVSSFLWVLKRKAEGLRDDSHLLAALDDEKLVGLMRFDTRRDIRVAYLWYLAVDPAARGRGLGSTCHEETLRWSREAGMRAAILEVEIPEECPTPEARAFAERRIEFYRRHGALTLQGIRYMHSAAPHQPTIPMHIMVCPFDPISAEEAFETARLLFGDEAVTRVGELALR